MSLFFPAKAKARNFFAAPQEENRRILYVVSFLQRISKSAGSNVWISPRALSKTERGEIPAVEWAAVRQFELLQEADNLAIWELDVVDLGKAFKDLMRMRAGGYRVTTITFGDYCGEESGGGGIYDELRIMDALLQEEISRLVHMMYLEQQSEAQSASKRKNIQEGTWTYSDALPHVAMTLNAERIFSAGRVSAKSALAARLLDLAERLPQGRLLHDVAVGLKLPDAGNVRNWVYIANPENRHLQMMTALNNVFGHFGCVSLDALNERCAAGKYDGPSAMTQLRGYGDMTRPENLPHYRAMARYGTEPVLSAAA